MLISFIFRLNAHFEWPTFSLFRVLICLSKRFRYASALLIFHFALDTHAFSPYFLFIYRVSIIDCVYFHSYQLYTRNVFPFYCLTTSLCAVIVLLHTLLPIFLWCHFNIVGMCTHFQLDFSSLWCRYFEFGHDAFLEIPFLQILFASTSGVSIAEILFTSIYFIWYCNNDKHFKWMLLFFDRWFVLELQTHFRGIYISIWFNEALSRDKTRFNDAIFRRFPAQLSPFLQKFHLLPV